MYDDTQRCQCKTNRFYSLRNCKMYKQQTSIAHTKFNADLLHFKNILKDWFQCKELKPNRKDCVTATNRRLKQNRFGILESHNKDWAVNERKWTNFKLTMTQVGWTDSVPLSLRLELEIERAEMFIICQRNTATMLILSLINELHPSPISAVFHAQSSPNYCAKSTHYSNSYTIST